MGGPQDERLVAIVAAPVEQRRRFGVGAGDDQARHAHDVELEARRGEALQLLVLGDQHLAALVAALLHARLLVLDVVARHAHLDEAADEVADVGVAAVARVGIGDDEGPEVHLGRDLALLLGHAGAGVELVLVRGEQGADDRRRLVGHLGERIAGEVGTGVLERGTLGGGGPPAEVDALDPHPLHRHRLAGGIGAEGGDAPLLREELAQARVERLGGAPGDRVLRSDGAALLDHLARGVDALDAREPRALEPSAELCDLFREVHLSLLGSAGPRRDGWP